MLKVQALTKYYGKNKGINNLSFSLEKQEILGVVGANGSGKTTTFRLLLGLLMPDSGYMEYEGQDVSLLGNDVFGYLPEDRSVYRDLKVEEQLRFLARLKNMDSLKIEIAIDHWLTRLEISEHRHRLIKELSKGNQQKVQLICALIHDPKIIIFDEPLSGLDISNVNMIKKLINELKSEQKMILISSHQYEYIEEFCEKMILLDKGEVRYYGRVNDLKFKSEIRYISINSVDQCSYLDQEGVLGQQRSANITRLLMVNETKAKKLVRKLLKEDNLVSLKIELPTIGDIINHGDLT